SSDHAPSRISRCNRSAPKRSMASGLKPSIEITITWSVTAPGRSGPAPTGRQPATTPASSSTATPPRRRQLLLSCFTPLLVFAAPRAAPAARQWHPARRPRSWMDFLTSCESIIWLYPRPARSVPVGVAGGVRHRTPPATGLRGHVPRRGSAHAFETGVGLVPAARLGHRLPIHEHHVGGEVVAVLEERGADAVGVHGDAELLEVADLPGVEPAGGDDLHVPEARIVERAAHVPHELRVDAAGVELAHLGNDRAVHERL